MGLVFLLLTAALYFLPTIIACKKKNLVGIFLLNFFLGWTFLGWVGALVWAACAEEGK